MASDVDVSVVLPVYNEASVLELLIEKLSSKLKGLNRSHEIICVDDGSTDGSYDILRTLAGAHTCIRILHFPENMGQTAALDAGIQASCGRYVILMDADLQNDPDEIDMFISGLDDGYDIVSGWRRRRVDGFLSRRLPSKIANWLMRLASGIKLHDFGSTYKGYRGDLIRRVSLYSDGFHRFVPVLLKPYHPKILEVAIKNTGRTSGSSSYGLGRVPTVLWDIIKLGIISRFGTRPLDFIGPPSLFLLSIGGIILIVLLLKKLFCGVSILATHGLLLALSILLILMGIQLLSIGLVMELNLYYSRRKRIDEERSLDEK